MSKMAEHCKHFLIGLCGYPLLTTEGRHLIRNNPPKSIQVVFVPADGSPRRYKTLHTVETNIKSPEPPMTRTALYAQKVACAREAHLIFHQKKSFFQPESFFRPDINFLPDIKGHGYWDDESWNRRCVTGTAEYHLFFTRSSSGLRPNPHAYDRVSGDIFILKVSDTKDSRGKHFYVDMESGDTWPGESVQHLLDLPFLA